MNDWGKRAAARMLALSMALSVAACGGGGGSGGDPGGAGSSTSGGTGSTHPSNQPLGAYSSWRTVPRSVLGPLGYPYYIQVFEYYFVTFYDNGLAYVGPPETDANATRCDAPRAAADGTKLCVPYSVANGQLVLDGESRTLTSQADGVWMYGDTAFTPMPDTRNDKLNGEYSSIDCYWATCTRAWIKFTADGRYTLDTLNTSVFTVPDFFSSDVVNSGSAAGTYQIGANTMVLTPDGGKPVTVFYFRDRTDSSDTVLLGDARYRVDQP